MFQVQYSHLPTVQLKPRAMTEEEEESHPGYKCPVYVTQVINVQFQKGMMNNIYIFRLGLEPPTQRVTPPTLFSTSTSPRTGTRVTGQTGAWPPRVKWTRDNSISGEKTRASFHDPDLNLINAFCTVFVFVLLLLL